MSNITEFVVLFSVATSIIGTVALCGFIQRQTREQTLREGRKLRLVTNTRPGI